MDTPKPQRTIGKETRQRLDADKDDILDAIAAGERIISIARRYGITTRTLNRWAVLYRTEWEDAMLESAAVLTELADELLEYANPDSSADVARARYRAEGLRWLASKRNRKFADDTRIQIGDTKISIGALHIHAMRQQLAPANPTPALDETIEASYELLPPAAESAESN